MTNRQPVIFCDFDGTITEQDNIVALMQHFDPDGWTGIVDRIVSGEISIRQGVNDMFALLPASRKDEIIAFAVDNAVIRRGFRQLLDYCRERGIPFYVVSGGIDFFIHPLLEPFPIERDHIYCNIGDFAGERIRIEWPHACDETCDRDCGTCKPGIMKRFPPDRHYRIVIGDSITDFAAARIADLVFARSHLVTQCENEGKPYVPFADFRDVLAYLNEHPADMHAAKEEDHDDATLYG